MKRPLTFVFLILILSSPSISAHRDKRDEKARGQKIERTISADANVWISVCLASGSISVHGWDRNEVRAHSSEAAEIQFQRDEPNSSKAAKKISLLVLDKMPGAKHGGPCESFSELELDVPRGATVQLKTRDSDISVVDVATIYANTQNGDVEIEHASKSVDAGTIGGAISLKTSSGSISLHSAGGSIDADNVRPTEAGDSFEATSLGGDITLNHIGHTQVKARTLNGSLCLTGALAHGGRYDLRTTSGDLNLTLPADSSFKVIANFSQSAEVITDFPLTLLPQPSVHPMPAPAPFPAPSPSANSTPPEPPVAVDEEGGRAKVKTKKSGTIVIDLPSFALRRIEGIHGTGDATLILASFSGTIHLHKK